MLVGWLWFFEGSLFIFFFFFPSFALLPSIPNCQFTIWWLAFPSALFCFVRNCLILRVISFNSSISHNSLANDTHLCTSLLSFSQIAPFIALRTLALCKLFTRTDSLTHTHSLPTRTQFPITHRNHIHIHIHIHIYTHILHSQVTIVDKRGAHPSSTKTVVFGFWLFTLFASRQSRDDSHSSIRSWFIHSSPRSSFTYTLLLHATLPIPSHPHPPRTPSLSVIQPHTKKESERTFAYSYGYTHLFSSFHFIFHFISSRTHSLSSLPPPPFSHKKTTSFILQLSSSDPYNPLSISPHTLNSQWLIRARRVH